MNKNQHFIFIGILGAFLLITTVTNESLPATTGYKSNLNGTLSLENSISHSENPLGAKETGEIEKEHGTEIAHVSGGTHESEREHGSEEEYGNSTHGHEDSSHGHGHSPGHAVIWPSTFAMMFFITVVGFMYYYLYTKFHMKKHIKDDHEKNHYFREAVIASTVAGAATPGLLGFTDAKTPDANKPSTSSGRNASTKTDPSSSTIGTVTYESSGILGVELSPVKQATEQKNDNMQISRSGNEESVEHHASPPDYHTLHQ